MSGRVTDGRLGANVPVRSGICSGPGMVRETSKRADGKAHCIAQENDSKNYISVVLLDEVFRPKLTRILPPPRPPIAVDCLVFLVVLAEFDPQDPFPVPLGSECCE